MSLLISCLPNPRQSFFKSCFVFEELPDFESVRSAPDSGGAFGGLGRPSRREAPPPAEPVRPALSAPPAAPAAAPEARPTAPAEPVKVADATRSLGGRPAEAAAPAAEGAAPAAAREAAWRKAKDRKRPPKERLRAERLVVASKEAVPPASTVSAEIKTRPPEWQTSYNTNLAAYQEALKTTYGKFFSDAYVNSEPFKAAFGRVVDYLLRNQNDPDKLFFSVALQNITPQERLAILPPLVFWNSYLAYLKKQYPPDAVDQLLTPSKEREAAFAKLALIAPPFEGNIDWKALLDQAGLKPQENALLLPSALIAAKQFPEIQDMNENPLFDYRPFDIQQTRPIFLGRLEGFKWELSHMTLALFSGAPPKIKLLQNLPNPATKKLLDELLRFGKLHHEARMNPGYDFTKLAPEGIATIGDLRSREFKARADLTAALQTDLRRSYQNFGKWLKVHDLPEELRFAREDWQDRIPEVYRQNRQPIFETFTDPNRVTVFKSYREMQRNIPPEKLARLGNAFRGYSRIEMLEGINAAIYLRNLDIFSKQMSTPFPFYTVGESTEKKVA